MHWVVVGGRGVGVRYEGSRSNWQTNKMGFVFFKFYVKIQFFNYVF